MKQIVVALLLQVLVLPVVAAETPKECNLCVGAVVDAPVNPPAAIPLLMQVRLDDLATAAATVDALTPEQRKKTTLVVSYDVASNTDPLLDVESRTKSIIEWAQIHGPFDSLGISVNADDATSAYAIKRLSVTAQGQNAASRIVLGPTPLDRLAKLYENGANAYFDVLLVDGSSVAAAYAWFAEHDPVKKIFATVTPQAPNAFYDAAKALADGAVRAYVQPCHSERSEESRGTTTPSLARRDPSQARDDTGCLAAVANLNTALAGEYAYDSTAKPTVLDAKGNPIDMPVLTFVRGEDLRSVVFPRGDAAAATIVSLATDRYTRPRLVDAAGDRAVTDTGARGGRFLIGTQPARGPFALTVDYAEKPEVTREAISVATERGITVEEIIRNHQSYDAYQESIQPRYIARNTTKLRFDIGGGAEALEATIAGDYFSEPGGRTDWVWQDFYINGVKWKYGRIPEIPIIQPERVSQLPLDIHLTNEYRYQLVRETDMLGYRTYEVRFEPPPNAPAALPLYRGTVWIDKKTWARVRISMIQLHLAGEILSNEERVDFQPFARGTHAPLTASQVAAADPREIVWLPADVSAQQVVSAIGRASVVQRTTSFTNFQIDTPEFDRRHAEVSATDARMVRETDAGLRYLEKRGDGARVVKEGFDTSRLFALGGIHHDDGLDYPVVPLGGIDYFNFNLGKRGIQTNVFFAGVILAANATHPNVANTRTNLGADFFGIAIAGENQMFRNGEEVEAEAVKARPVLLNLRAGHPVFRFGKIDVNLNLRHESYSRADDTAADFIVPTSTFVITPSIEARYSRWGYSASASYDYSTRTSWEPWGNLDEYDPDQKTFTRWQASLGKTFYLPKFQRLGLDVNYIGGQRLDRFSKYELGFFGANRVHGIRSGSVHAEEAIIGHVSYGFVFSQQFRLEAFYDHALIDDSTSGLRREPFQGLGIAGQTIGPYGTLLRLDIGKTVGRNAQDGFVANVVFLKLF